MNNNKEYVCIKEYQHWGGTKYELGQVIPSYVYTLSEAKDHFVELKRKESTINLDHAHLLVNSETPLTIEDNIASDIISELDEYARDYNHCEYGLPSNDEQLEKMKAIIIRILNKQEKDGKGL